MTKFRYRLLGAVVALAAVTATLEGTDRKTLVDAVKDGDAQLIDTLLARRVDVNQSSADGTTPLLLAVHRDDMKMVGRLIEAGGNVKTPNKLGVAPLSIAAENGNAAMVELLLASGADPDTTLPGGETVLMTAARTGELGVIRTLLSRGAKVDTRERTRDQTALMWAASHGRAGAVKALIAAGADLNARSSELKVFFENAYVAGSKSSESKERLPMFTPFLFAVMGGHLEAAIALLDLGADINDTPPNKVPALHIAINNAHWELAMMLLERGADPNAQSPGGAALHQIARVRAEKILVKNGGLPPPVSAGTRSSLDFARAAIEYGADPNGRVVQPSPSMYGTRGGQTNQTPLMMAVVPSDPDYLQLLLEAGADPTVTTGNHTNLLMMAAGVGGGISLGDEVEALANLKTLLATGKLDINAQNDNGDTAMHGATFRNYVPLLQYLADKGAKLDPKNKVGWTPLMEAHWSGAGFLSTRPEAEAFLREQYAAHGIPQTVTSREEAIALFNSKGGPVVSCPEGKTIHSPIPTVVNYPEATAYAHGGSAKVPSICLPASGSTFPLGTTTVVCSATDPNNRNDTCSVLMKVSP